MTVILPFFFFTLHFFFGKDQNPISLGPPFSRQLYHKEEEQMKDEEAVRHVDLLMRIGRDPHDSHRQIRIL